MRATGQRYGMAMQAGPAAPARDAARRLGLVANGSWSARSCFAVTTIDHKHPRPRRPMVISS